MPISKQLRRGGRNCPATIANLRGGATAATVAQPSCNCGATTRNYLPSIQCATAATVPLQDGLRLRVPNLVARLLPFIVAKEPREETAGRRRGCPPPRARDRRRAMVGAAERRKPK